MELLHSLNENDVLLFYVHCDIYRIKEQNVKMTPFIMKYVFRNSNVTFLYDVRGIPILNGIQMNISVSHSNSLFVCVFSKISVGIDIEFRRFVSDKAFDFANSMFGNILDIDDLIGWVKLESLLKLKKKGLDDVIKKELNTEAIKFTEINEFKEYITILAHEEKINSLIFKELQFNKILEYDKHV